ncbi:MAG: GDP-L-fucose synthase [Alphaproteobacteria bacterium]|nr:GDP-L-fucose synthase [Alphaproteobacteria bacterium]OJV12016.1 MAG: GDP-fucose synthetase [Alphaproteobacteria bacterium 33-17]
MKADSKILITGATGLIGSSLKKILEQQGYKNIVCIASKDCDLRSKQEVDKLFQSVNPEYVFHMAAIVGGIKANSTYPAKFIYDNTMMQANIVHACYEYKVAKLLFCGSSCTYPKIENATMDESKLYQGMPEPTNIAYATAKLNGVIMCQSYAKEHGLNVVIVMPTNTYGTNDHYNLENSHVIPALIMKFYKAKSENADKVTLWGSGTPYREFIYSDDVADAFVFLMNNYNSSEVINVGSMEEVRIKELAEIVKEVTGFAGIIDFDPNYPDGIMRKCLDSNKLFNMGWKPSLKLKDGIKKVYDHYLSVVTQEA